MKRRVCSVGDEAYDEIPHLKNGFRKRWSSRSSGGWCAPSIFRSCFYDPEAERICDSLDYDFADKRKKMESAAGLFGVQDGRGEKLFQAMAARFPGGVLAFDSCNKRGAKPAYMSFRALSGSGSHDSVTDKENAWIRTYLSYERKR